MGPIFFSDRSLTVPHVSIQKTKSFVIYGTRPFMHPGFLHAVLSEGNAFLPSHTWRTYRNLSYTVVGNVDRALAKDNVSKIPEKVSILTLFPNI